MQPVLDHLGLITIAYLVALAVLEHRNVITARQVSYAYVGGITAQTYLLFVKGDPSPWIVLTAALAAYIAWSLYDTRPRRTGPDESHEAL